jgi:hypothetical protein
MEVCTNCIRVLTYCRAFTKVDGSLQRQDGLAWASSRSTMRNVNRRSFGMEAKGRPTDKKEDTRYKEEWERDDEGCQWCCISCKHCTKRKYTHRKTYFVGKGTA